MRDVFMAEEDKESKLRAKIGKVIPQTRFNPLVFQYGWRETEPCLYQLQPETLRFRDSERVLQR